MRTINDHIQNIFSEGELHENSDIRNSRITAADGKSYDTKHFNLDAILAVGYRVSSRRGTQFRQWATARLSEYHAFLDTQPRKVDLDFEQAVKQLPKAAPASKPARKPKPPTG